MLSDIALRYDPFWIHKKSLVFAFFLTLFSEIKLMEDKETAMSNRTPNKKGTLKNYIQRYLENIQYKANFNIETLSYFYINLIRRW